MGCRPASSWDGRVFAITVGAVAIAAVESNTNAVILDFIVVALVAVDTNSNAVILDVIVVVVALI